MEVRRQEPNRRKVAFALIKVGETFWCHTVLCMKIHFLEGRLYTGPKINEWTGGVKANAIVLNDGRPTYFADEELVEPVKAVAIIEE